jgi:hypothetical protein
VFTNASGYLESVVDIDIDFQVRMGHVSHHCVCAGKGFLGGLFVSTSIMVKFEFSVGPMAAGGLQISGRAEAM